MPLPWGFAPDQVPGPVRLWLGEHDRLVPPRVWQNRPGGFPNGGTTVVPGAGHFFIAERMAEIVRTL
jgi:pimeloyl-ACP methyl ester carboxylesterase